MKKMKYVWFGSMAAFMIASGIAGNIAGCFVLLGLYLLATTVACLIHKGIG